MKAFITGGSGFIGRRLTERLASEGHQIAVLLRNPSGALFSQHHNISILKGDISDKKVLHEGMKNCDVVFHLAAYTEAWSKDSATPYNVNVEGTINVLEAATACRVSKVIFTSTCGTLGYSESGNIIDESAGNRTDYLTVYEKTKAEAERKVIEFCHRGLFAVIVNPSRIYGPGKLSRGNSLTKIIGLYIRGLWRIVPGDGKSIGNYVFIDDVIEGHMLAAEKGFPGERYILGGENLSFSQLFAITGKVSGKRRKMIYLPSRIMKAAARLMKTVSTLFNVPPLITEEWIDKYGRDAIISSEKAIAGLGYRITPFSEGVRKTIVWLRSDNG